MEMFIVLTVLVGSQVSSCALINQRARFQHGFLVCQLYLKEKHRDQKRELRMEWFCRQKTPHPRLPFRHLF